MKKLNDYVEENIEFLFNDENLYKKFVYLPKDADIQEMLDFKRIDKRKQLLMKNLLNYLEQFVTVHRRRLKKRKLKEVLEFTDKSK